MKFKLDIDALNSPLIAKISLAVYAAMFVFLVVFGFYIITYTLFLIAFLLLFLNFSNLKLFRSIEAKPFNQKILLIFFVALILRFLLLAQDQVITRDVVVYVQRAKLMMGGQIPYEDVSINKPPLYAYLIHFLGLTIGAGQIQFRAFFSLMDSVVAVLLFYLCMCKHEERFSFKASFAYAICPLPIVSIGLSGHYEPVVMIFVVLSLFYLFKNKFEISGLLLGIAFAFKFFPIVLLPFFAWKIKHWNRRIFYGLLFFIPLIISIIPMLIFSPNAFSNYLYEQGYSWPAKKSFAWAIELITGTGHIFSLKISLIIMALFLAMILLMFLLWLRKRYDAKFWFKIVVLTYVIYYGLFITASIKFYHSDLGIADRYTAPIMMIFVLLYFGTISPFLYKFVQEFEFKMEKREEMFILCAFSLIFLLFGSSQYNAWYVLWFLPFVLAIKNRYVRIILLWLMFWSYEGLGISLLPGLSLA